MRIDSHQHFWKFDPIRDSWIDQSMEAIQKDFLPPHLKPLLQANKIEACIAVQADQSETETEFLLDCAAKNSFIKGVVGWVDLRAHNVEARLQHYSQNTLFKGVRHIVQAEANDFMLSADFQKGVGKLEEFNLTYDILIFPSQLTAAIALVKKFPNQKFVIDHMAKPEIKLGKIEKWQKHIKTIAQYPNVYCKISGMTTEADWKHWSTKDFYAYLDVVFEVFGTNRIMYGSDWPVCLLAATYKEQLQILETYIKTLSIDEQIKIMGTNAVGFYQVLETKAGNN